MKKRNLKKYNRAGNNFKQKINIEHSLQGMHFIQIQFYTEACVTYNQLLCVWDVM